MQSVFFVLSVIIVHRCVPSDQSILNLPSDNAHAHWKRKKRIILNAHAHRK